MEIKTYTPISLESWDLKKPSIPSRSQLYPIEPLGLRTPFTESLTSFISRLAMAHCLPPGILMERLLTPVVGKTHGGANLHKIYPFTGALNGAGEMAKNLVNALETLTLRNDLCLLTMLPWSKFFPHRHLLRTERAWCSVCYQDWASKRRIIYEPLLWSLEAIQVCSLHRRRLVQHCPHCHKKNYPLAWNSRPGFCSKCQEWLGASSEDELPGQEESLGEESVFEIWSANTVGEFIASTPDSPFYLTNDRIAKAFSIYVDHLAEGNIAELARQLKIPKNTLWLWCQGNNRPTFTKLVEACFRLRVSLSEFLMADPPLKKCQEVKLLPVKCQPTSRAGAQFWDLQAIRIYLEETLGIDKQPYPSLEEVARILGRDRRTLVKHFPELCRAIAARYLNQRQANKLQAIAQCCEEVRQAAFKLHEQGIYPSEARITELLTKPGFLRYKEVREAVHAAKEEIGLTTRTSK